MRYPVKPRRGQPITAELLCQVIDCLREVTPVAGPNIRVSHTPGGSIITGKPGGAAAVADVVPWTVRHHVTEDDEDGQWEIWLPPGCMSVRGPLVPINKPASEKSGHDNDKPGWYALAIDEDEGDATIDRTTGAGEDETHVTGRAWDIVARAKTSALLDGVDPINGPAKRYLYVSATKQLSSQEEQAQTDEDRVRDTWGDEFAQVVGSLEIGTATKSGETSDWLKFTQRVSIPLSVQGNVASNFDLLWVFGFDGETGKLAVSNVYCVRNSTAVAGINAVGPTMVDVTDAAADIYARIDTNAAAGNALTGQNVVSVLIDPQPATSDEYVTWLRLYSMADNAVVADYRASSLVNVQAFR